MSTTIHIRTRRRRINLALSCCTLGITCITQTIGFIVPCNNALTVVGASYTQAWAGSWHAFFACWITIVINGCTVAIVTAADG